MSTSIRGRDLDYIEEGDADVAAFRGELIAVTKERSAFDSGRELAVFAFGNIQEAVNYKGDLLPMDVYYIRVKLSSHRDAHLRAFLASAYGHLWGGLEMPSLNDGLVAVRSLIGTQSVLHCRGEQREYSNYSTGAVTVGQCWVVEAIDLH